jgi:hypothetical protein
MTVGELKKALRGIPDDITVTALKDGVYCERTDVWDASFDKYEEDGETIEQFTINC